MTDDLAAVVAGFGAALRAAGLPVGPDRCQRFARAIALIGPKTTAELRECALATLASSREHAEMLVRVFEATLGSAGLSPAGTAVPSLPPAAPAAASLPADTEQATVSDGGPGYSDGADGPDTLTRLARAAREHAPGESAPGRDGSTGPRALPSAAEQLADAMRRLTLAVPTRPSRRQHRGPRGSRADLRATLRHARLTGGVPFGIIKQMPKRRPRKLVVLCDISGSMEPYARAMLQLLYCAAGGARAEVFSFATRLTRLTSALAQPRAELALRQAGQTAPDWLGGTRIGGALKEFNDSFGCRGLARGAVVVVVSDGWDTGDPAVVRREMRRLSLVAFRIVWVNPRSGRPGYRPLAAGMAAAWPFCDAIVGAHRLDALGELTSALADPVRRRDRNDRMETAGRGEPAGRLVVADQRGLSWISRDCRS
jgi:uncharacterized protein